MKVPTISQALVVLLAISVTTVISAHTDARQLRQQIISAEGDTVVTEYVQSEVTVLGWKDSAWIESYHSSATYDSLLRIDQILEEVPPGAKHPYFTNSSKVRTKFQYDPKNGVDALVQEGWSDSTRSWVRIGMGRTVRDKAGHVIESTTEHLNTEVSKGGTRTHHEYDKIGKLTRTTTERLKDGKWINDRSVMYTRADNPAIQTQLNEIWEGGKWVPLSELTITIDAAKGLRILSTRALAKNAGSSSVVTILTTVDASGRHEEEVESDSAVGMGRAIFRKYITTKDSMGNTVETEFQWSDSGLSSWHRAGRTLAAYKVHQVRIPRKFARGNDAPSEFALFNNFPNPFNSRTNLRFIVPRQSRVDVRIYDILGREVETVLSEIREAGDFTVPWESHDLASGIYFVRMVAGEFNQVRKMNLIK